MSKLLNIYFTAGYPKLDSTTDILQTLDRLKVDFVEIGIPYSDPLADGPTIQASSAKALDNGITIDMIFEQLDAYDCQHSELIIMAYYNSLLCYGMANFLDQCNRVGVKSLIIPDLPYEVYQRQYATLFEEKGIGMVFLVTPATDEKRIQDLARVSSPFLYLVSSSSTTGNETKTKFDHCFFRELSNMSLQVPCLTGFNISDRAGFDSATEYTQGGIIGSAFIKAISDSNNLQSDIQTFITNIRS